MSSSQQSIPLHSGLKCLAALAGFHQVAVDPQQLQANFSAAGEVTPTDLIRAAREIGFKARIVTFSLNKIQQASLPAIASTKGGQYFIIARLAEEADQSSPKILIHDLSEANPRTISLEELEEL